MTPNYPDVRQRRTLRCLIFGHQLTSYRQPWDPSRLVIFCKRNGCNFDVSAIKRS